LAVQTRTAQMEDRVEQQQLKRLVLNYEQREGAEELKGASHLTVKVHPSSFPFLLALDAQSRPIKIRLAG
jgi:hypothetical protein